MFSFLFGKKQPRNVVLEGRAEPVVVKGKETILEAALSAGVPFPSDCRVGACGTCKCRLIEGQVEERSEKAYVLSKSDIAAGYILGCQSSPKTDIRIALDAQSVALHPTVKTKGRIVRRTLLTHDTARVEIEVEAPVTYTAGQYARVTVPTLTPEDRSYSFARAPRLAGGERTLVFYVREVPGGALSPGLVRAAIEGTDVAIDGPHGDFRLRDGTSPILLIAGGSGLAPIRAIVEDVVARRVPRPMTLLFGARTERDLYDVAELEQLGTNAPGGLRFVPVLSHEPEGSPWAGARGLVTTAIAAHLGAAKQAYLCGPPPMIDAALVELAKHGLGSDAVYFDKFTDKSHAPRAAT